MVDERVFVGLGANLPDGKVSPQATLVSAIRQLRTLPQTTVVATSSCWRSAPVDATGPDYLNAVAELQTQVEPLPLLAMLQQIEAEHGRSRPYRNAPRSLDLDLLLYGDRQLRCPVLTVPHPRLHERLFVLEPLAELAPDLLVPGLGSLRAWRERCFGQALERLPATAFFEQAARAGAPPIRS